MNRIIKLIGCVLLIFSPFTLYAQLSLDSADQDQVVINSTETDDNKIDVPNIKASGDKKIHTGLEAGTSFSYAPGNFYGPSYYIAPNISYLVSPRFLLEAGAGIVRSNYYALYNDRGINSGMLPMTRAFLYTKGSYFLTSRLTVDGTVYKTLNDVPKLTKYSSPIKYSQNGAIVGFNYKINNSLSFGFHVQMTNSSFQSQNPDFFNPFFGY